MSFTRTATRHAWLHWDAFRRFHTGMVISRDVDPVYPVLRRAAATVGLRRADIVDLVFLHVAYYHLGSTAAAWYERFARSASFESLTELSLPFGTERRGHRDPAQFARHMAALQELQDRYGRLNDWLAARGASDLVDHLMTVHGNGRWAAYKTAEMLQEVADMPAGLVDMRILASTGPLAGLRLLVPEGVRADETTAAALVADLAGIGAPGATAAVVETTLCDFHSMAAGRYYVGHDIDVMAEQLTRVPSPGATPMWEARAAVLPMEYLGEMNNWTGTDLTRKRHFLRTGEVLLREKSW